MDSEKLKKISEHINYKGISVRELISFLAKQDPESIVIMSSDEEGNGYAPCCAAERGVWDKKNQEPLSEYSIGEKTLNIVIDDPETQQKCVFLIPS